MPSPHLRHITVSGTPYELGFQYGQVFAADIQRNVLAIDPDKILAARGRLIEQALLATEAEFPTYLEELRGIAKGTKMPFSQIFAYNCPEIRGDFYGCSSVAIQTQEELFLAHNEDGEPRQSVADVALIEFQHSNHTVTALTYLGELAGNAFGWNSYGLFFTINDLCPAAMALDRIPRHFLARAVAEQPSIDAAIALLKRIRDASGFHYYLGSMTERRLVSIETTVDTVSVEPVMGIHCHTNHYLHGALRQQQSFSGPSTYRRLERLAELTATTPLGAGELRTILADRAGAPYCLYPQFAGEANRTLAAVLFDGAEQTATIYAAGVDDPRPLTLPLST